MKYYGVTRSGDGDHLQHLFGIGRKNHKYVARVPVGSGYKYFYSNTEFAAYKAGQIGKAAGDSAKNAVSAVDKKVGVSTLIKKKKAGKAMKSNLENQAKNIAGAFAIVKGDIGKPGDDFSKKWAETLKRDKRKTERTTKEYGKAANEFDKTLLGKVSKVGDVGKKLTDAGKSASSLAKKAAHAVKWQSTNYDATEDYGNNTIVKRKYKLYKKRFGEKYWNVDHKKTAVGISTNGGKTYQWSNRPHVRKVKIKEGAAKVKKGTKVSK